MDIQRDDTPGSRDDLLRHCDHLTTSVAWVNLELYKEFKPEHTAWAEKEQKKLVRDHFNGIIRGCLND